VKQLSGGQLTPGDEYIREYRLPSGEYTGSQLHGVIGKESEQVYKKLAGDK
jgi:hypothetical protein